MSRLQIKISMPRLAATSFLWPNADPTHTNFSSVPVHHHFSLKVTHFTFIYGEFLQVTGQPYCAEEARIYLLNLRGRLDPQRGEEGRVCPRGKSVPSNSYFESEKGRDRTFSLFEFTSGPTEVRISTGGRPPLPIDRQTPHPPKSASTKSGALS